MLLGSPCTSRWWLSTPRVLALSAAEYTRVPSIMKFGTPDHSCAYVQICLGAYTRFWWIWHRWYETPPMLQLINMSTSCEDRRCCVPRSSIINCGALRWKLALTENQGPSGNHISVSIQEKLTCFLQVNFNIWSLPHVDNKRRQICNRRLKVGSDDNAVQ